MEQRHEQLPAPPGYWQCQWLIEKATPLLRLGRKEQMFGTK
jgi:hypothetical protein